MKKNIIILAAGLGTRMHSKIAKVLHDFAGRPILTRIMQELLPLDVEKIFVVYGAYKEQIMAELEKFSNEKIVPIYQEKQLGTGNAIATVLPLLDHESQSVILYADTPLISGKFVESLFSENNFTVVTTRLSDPTGFGRIIEENGFISKIVEEKEANPAEKKITEINTGIMAIQNSILQKYVPEIKNNNQKQEYYLTDLVEIATKNNLKVRKFFLEDSLMTTGINDQKELNLLEREYQKRLAYQFMEEGVAIKDPLRFDVRGTVTFGQDVTVDPNVILEGHNQIGNNVKIGMGAIIKDSKIGDNTEILPYSVIDSAEVCQNCSIGPFARLRPKTIVYDYAKVGNFTELKNTRLGEKSKANHLSYLGDAEIGKNVNIGAGNITCNYDGKNKFKTQIGDNAFIGSDCQLIAPVKIGNNVLVGAGSTITDDVADNMLALSRVKQIAKIRHAK